MINRNMGCIETLKDAKETLKGFEINRNMGCIETIVVCQIRLIHCPINRNMGCIETIMYQTKIRLGTRLIETWDVLKHRKTKKEEKKKV